LVVKNNIFFIKEDIVFVCFDSRCHAG